MPGRWKNRPEGSNWGDFGADDQLGRLNLLTLEKVRQGVDEVREGLTFSLSLPLDLPGGNLLNPRRHPPRLAATIREGRANFLYPFALENPEHTDVVCDDTVLLTLQYSTQFDSLAHVGHMFDADGDGTPEPVFYNGWRGGEDVLGPPSANGESNGPVVEGTQARALGIENMAAKAVQGRGVMIDLERHCGRDREWIGYDRLMRICDADGVEVETGDIVCLYTGFADLLIEMDGAPDERVHNSCAVLDGRDAQLLNWITDSGLSILIADNYAVEGHPARVPGDDLHAALPLHEHCLFKLGIHLGELFNLGELGRWLREHGRTRFLLTASPLRLPGAVGSPVPAVATV